MDNKQYQEAVKQAIKPAFGRKKVLPSKYTSLYPKNAEKEMKAVTNAYMKILKKEVKEHLPEIMAAYNRERHIDSRYDDLSDLKQELGRVFQKIAQNVEKAIASFGLKDKLHSVAHRVQKTSYQQWQRSVQKTVGIDLIENYYNADFYGDIVQKWVDQSVSMIQSIPQQELGQMEQIISDGFKKGSSISDIAQQIQDEYDVSKGKAQFLARDQIGTLNSQLARRQQEDAGVKKYIWRDSGDGKVRACHHALNGKICSWDDPPEMWQMKRGVRVNTGRRCHPGEDYGCRCHADPVFEYDELDLPMKKSESNANRERRFPDFGIASFFK